MINSIHTIFDNKVMPNMQKGRKFELIETDPSAKLKILTVKFHKEHISNGSSIVNAVFVELDQKTKPYDKISQFFCSHATGVNKSCDLLIFIERDEDIVVLICDLKSSSAGCEDDRAKAQFKNSLLFSNYFKDISKEFYNVTKPFKFFFVAFFPALPMPQLTLLGIQVKPKYLEYIDEIIVNKEIVNINANGQAEIDWKMILVRLP